MKRKLILVLSATALLAGMGIAPASANGTEEGQAAIVGEVHITTDPCTTDGVKSHDSDSGEYVDFVSLAMAGGFGNLDGIITLQQTIRACFVEDEVVGPAPIVGHGEIEAPAGGPDFQGTDLDENKCLTGEFLGGDFEQIGTKADVKFSIDFTTGPAPGCTGKTSGRADCIGSFTVAPVGQAGLNPYDVIAGEITCAVGNDTNVPKS